MDVAELAGLLNESAELIWTDNLVSTVFPSGSPPDAKWLLHPDQGVSEGANRLVSCLTSAETEGLLAEMVLRERPGIERLRQYVVNLVEHVSLSQESISRTMNDAFRSASQICCEYTGAEFRTGCLFPVRVEDLCTDGDDSRLVGGDAARRKELAKALGIRHKFPDSRILQGAEKCARQYWTALGDGARQVLELRYGLLCAIKLVCGFLASLERAHGDGKLTETPAAATVASGGRALKKSVGTSTGNGYDSLSPMTRPILIAQAARAAGMRPDLLLKRLRARKYAIAGVKGSSEAEWAHVLLALPPAKRRQVKAWVEKNFPSE
ncbi:MAG: hypothetical protein AABZ53_17565 [Planctomycetota bacterium]